MAGDTTSGTRGTFIGRQAKLDPDIDIVVIVIVIINVIFTVTVVVIVTELDVLSQGNGTYSSSLLADRAVSIIEQHSGEQPLFLYLPFQVRLLLV